MPGDGTAEGSFTGDGPVEAFFSALNVACGREGRLKEYHVHAVTEGRDALAEVTVVLELEGVEATGQGVSPDTMEASGRAYLRALTNADRAERGGGEDRPPPAGGDHGARARRVTQAPFFFRDGERVIRFGDGVAADAAELLRGSGFDGDWVLLTTERARAQIPAGSLDGAVADLDVAAGPVPEAAAALLDEVGGRDVVAFGGGRVVDAAKAVTAVGGGRVAAIPTTLAGSTLHALPPDAHGPPGLRLGRAPGAGRVRPGADGLGAARHAHRHGHERPGARHRGAVRAAGQPGHRGRVAARRPADPGRARGRASPTPATWPSAPCSAAGRSGVAAGLVVHHACCQTLVGVLRTPHAPTNAVMLPRSIAFMADRAPGPLGLLAEALGEPDVRRRVRAGGAAWPPAPGPPRWPSSACRPATWTGSWTP